MEALKEKTCLIPYSLKKINDYLQDITNTIEQQKEVSDDLLNEFRSSAASFFSKYRKECDCDKCYEMITKLINIIISKINVKVLNFYGIALSSIEFSINDSNPTLTVVIEDKLTQPVAS